SGPDADLIRPCSGPAPARAPRDPRCACAPCQPWLARRCKAAGSLALAAPMKTETLGMARRYPRAPGATVSIPFALALGLALANCSERDEEPLWAVRNCKSHDQCAKANPLYDRCRWACGSDVTYCQVS